MKWLFLFALLGCATISMAQQQAAATAPMKEVHALIETSMGNIKVKLYNDTPIHRDNFIKLAKEGRYDGTLFYRVIKNFMIQAGSTASRGAIKGQAIDYGSQSVIIEAEIKDEHYHKRGALAAPRQPDRENAYKESDISQFYIVEGQKYDPKMLDLLEKKQNVPIRNAIQRKYLTPEKKALLDTLKAHKKVDEFREIADKIKQDIEFEWSNNREKMYMPDEKRDIYINQGGCLHLDKEYTVFGEVIEGLDVVDAISNTPTDDWDRPETDVTVKVTILDE